MNVTSSPIPIGRRVHCALPFLLLIRQYQQRYLHIYTPTSGDNDTHGYVPSTGVGSLPLWSMPEWTRSFNNNRGISATGRATKSYIHPSRASFELQTIGILYILAITNRCCVYQDEGRTDCASRLTLTPSLQSQPRYGTMLTYHSRFV